MGMEMGRGWMSSRSNGGDGGDGDCDGDGKLMMPLSAVVL